MKELSSIVQKFCFILFNIILLWFIAWEATANLTPRIYLIRHAVVDLEKTGWGNSKEAAQYKEAYNVAEIEKFNPETVLQKIKNHEMLDTVFCSPQKRALETAMMLFGENAVVRSDSVLAELDYPVVEIPVLQLPVKVWLFVSRVTWMTGINRGEKTNYRERTEALDAFADELIKVAHKNRKAVVVAHGMVNREMVKILKDRGWEYCENGKNGCGNLSVNCLEYSINKGAR